MVISAGSFFILLALVVIAVLLVLWASQTNYPGPIDLIRSIFARKAAVTSPVTTEKPIEAPAIPRRSVTVSIAPEIQAPPPRKSIKLPTISSVDIQTANSIDLEKKEERKADKGTLSIPSTPVVKDEYIYV